MAKVTAGRDELGEFAPKFAEINDDILFGEVWSREEKLSIRDRSIVTLTALMASGILDSSLKFHLSNAKIHGITKEEIAEAKQKKAEEKKQAADAKKAAKQEKKEAKKQEKERKAQEKALEKETKKAKKLEEAKQILEEVQETRINRVGATVVFALFAICAVGIAFGSDLFSYSVSVNNAEKSFNLALDNDVSYYNDAYEQIYGLEVKPEDQELNDKIMMVMFVNKELNSYNNYMVLEDYESALHSLLKGIYRYGKYYENAIPLGVDRDLDFVRKQILEELEKTFHISEDEAEVLRSQLEQAMGSDEASKEYSLAIYEIVQECKLTKE